MKLCLLEFFCIIFFCKNSFSQENYNRVKQVLEIKKTDKEIKIDGIGNEEAWQTANLAENFHQIRPYDSSYAKIKTEVKLSFDDKNIYVFARCYEKKADYTVSSLKRDFESGVSDVFVINLDTFKDRLNGFQFSVSPLNVQREGLITLGEEVSNFWDNKWYSEVKNCDEYWEVEIAIPFKSIRYKVSEENVWGLNFGRNTLKYNEISTWSPVPRNFRPASLAYAGDLVWTIPPPNPGANISMIPYISAGNFVENVRNKENLQPSNKVTDFTNGIGMDAKIAVTPSLNLDLTLNPDFSQVEVDQQQTNLNRFELFFPERRQFFLENSDLFGTFGFPDTRPFFSRRIGIARNPINGYNQQVRIIAGARLSGKLNNSLRVGLLNMQTKKVDFGNDLVQPTANYTVATLQQKVFERSTISGIFVNKALGMNGLTEVQSSKYEKFNRVGGLEFNYYSKDNRIQTETYYHQSFSPEQKSDAASVAHFMGYSHPNIELNFGVSRVGQNYKAETGFVPRQGYYSLFWPQKLNINPKNPEISKHFNMYGVGLYESQTIFDLKGKLLDNIINPYFHFSGPGGNNFFTGYGFVYTYLFFPFDPANSDLNPNPDAQSKGKPLPVGAYKFGNFFIGYESTNRNNISGDFSFEKGGFFNGKFTKFEGSIAYRVQPIGFFSIDYTFYDIKLPSPYSQAKYWLIGPKAEVSLSRSVFFSNYFQYNTQTNNFNINSRLQWRFKPVSDIYLVYTDNRFAEDITRYNVNSFAPKNKALVFKINYWFNV